MGKQRMLISKAHSTRMRNAAIVSVALLVFYLFLLQHPDQGRPGSSRSTAAAFNDFPPVAGHGSSAKKPSPRPKLPPELLNNRLMTAQQCADTFPGLTKEIDDLVAKGPFTLTKTGELGPLLARIKDGKVGYLVSNSMQIGYIENSMGNVAGVSI